MSLQKSTLAFLENLKDNNNKAWFDENRKVYEAARSNFHAFIETLIGEISKYDKTVSGLLVKDTTFRINRDIRFSKDKTPYKTEMGAIIRKDGKNSPWAGYYFRIGAGGISGMGGGLYEIEPKNLERIRKDIAGGGKELKKIIGNADFIKTFGSLYENVVKTAPRGYPKDHPEIELLRYRSFFVMKPVSKKDIFSKDFVSYLAGLFLKVKPLNDYLNGIILK